jgi:hypothetical protein
MRVNIYAEEMTDRLEIIGKEIDGHTFTGLRFYLELPATLPDGTNYAAPFMHRPGDDDSAAVTFWGKRDLRTVLRKALAMLDEHYGPSTPSQESPSREPGREIFGANCQECGNWVEMNPDAPLAPSAPNAVDPVREALRKLVEQIDVVIASPEYESVFAMGMIRGQPYRGPQFADQLEAARRALESTPSREKP